MRLGTSRALVPTALCTFLLVTTVGPASATLTAAHAAATHSQVPAPDTRELKQRSDTLRHASGLPATMVGPLDDLQEAASKVSTTRDTQAKDSASLWLQRSTRCART